MKRISKIILGLAATLAVGYTAYASVTVDENGIGFVGKGDVQLAYDWHNAQLQANATGLTFSFTTTEEVSYDCERDTGNPSNPKSITHHTQTRTTIQSVVAAIAYDARKNKQGQITGFNLNGFEGQPTVTGGDPLTDCQSLGGFNHSITNQQETLIDGGSLMVNHASEGSRPLPISQ